MNVHIPCSSIKLCFFQVWERLKHFVLSKMHIIAAKVCWLIAMCAQSLKPSVCNAVQCLLVHAAHSKCIAACRVGKPWHQSAALTGCGKVDVHLRRHGPLGSWILFIIICLFLFGSCCLACCLSAVIYALHRPRQNAMRNEALHTVQRCIHKLRLAGLNRHSQHIQQFCSTNCCCDIGTRVQFGRSSI